MYSITSGTFRAIMSLVSKIDRTYGFVVNRIHTINTSDVKLIETTKARTANAILNFFFFFYVLYLFISRCETVVSGPHGNQTSMSIKSINAIEIKNKI